MTRGVMIVVIVVQAALLLAEAVWQYDSLARRVALMLTNMVATAGLLWYFKQTRPSVRGWIITWCIAAGAIWLDALGNFFGLYGRWWWLDHMTHGLGTAAVMIMAGGLWAARFPELSPRMLAWLGLLVSQAFGAWYEISEYLGDVFFGTHRVGGGYDTVRDLWFNLLGGLLGWLIWRAQYRVAMRRPKMV